MIPMIGMSTGAGNHARARKIAWKGALTAAVMCECIGVAAAVCPDAWLTLFTREPEVIRIGSAYLQRVGPGFGMFGLGLALYFASQGAKQMGWSVVAAVSRAAIVASASWIVAAGDKAELNELLDILLLAMACYAFLNSVPWIRGKNRDAV
ncbi:MATE family efflux transporter [Cupriavidus sp. TMH.W2]|uniref:MATE family efflux transporter n=1 Tax=Cupriavidus sp. TMH.W2 TaxID=3434465 RepID=UPI003D77CC8B